MAFRRIQESDMLNKGNIGQPDTPGVEPLAMQEILDQLPREVIAPIFNELCAALEASTAAGQIGAQGTGGAASTVQRVVQAIATALETHKSDSENPHGVTAEQVGSYTKQAVEALIDQKIIDIGAGDMAKAEFVGPDATGVVHKADSAVSTDMFRAKLLSGGWASSGNAFTQTVACTGMKATYNVEAPECIPGTTQEEIEAQNEAMNILNGGRIETLEGQITATVYEQPASDLDIVMRRAIVPEVS